MICGCAKNAGGEGRTRWTATPEKAFDLTNNTQNNWQTKGVHYATTSFPTEKYKVHTEYKHYKKKPES